MLFEERQKKTLAFLKDEALFVEADRSFEEASRAVKEMPGRFFRVLDRKKAEATEAACQGALDVRKRDDARREEAAATAVSVCNAETGRLKKELAVTSRMAEAAGGKAPPDPRIAHGWDRKLQDARS